MEEAGGFAEAQMLGPLPNIGRSWGPTDLWELALPQFPHQVDPAPVGRQTLMSAGGGGLQEDGCGGMPRWGLRVGQKELGQKEALGCAHPAH